MSDDVTRYPPSQAGMIRASYGGDTAAYFADVVRSRRATAHAEAIEARAAQLAGQPRYSNGLG